jgi:hypothetical protein
MDGDHGLDEFPAELNDDGALMPWESDAAGPRWPFGADRGRLLSELPTARLVAKRKWLGTLVALAIALDTELLERGGS